MAYTPTEWKNRQVEKPRTYILQDNKDGTYTLIPAEGTVIEPGTPLNAENLNKLEQGVKNAHDIIDEHANKNAKDAHGGVIRTGDTMEGILSAQSNSSHTVRQVRNIILSFDDPDVDAMGEGDIHIKLRS